MSMDYINNRYYNDIFIKTTKMQDVTRSIEVWIKWFKIFHLQRDTFHVTLALWLSVTDTKA